MNPFLRDELTNILIEELAVDGVKRQGGGPICWMGLHEKLEAAEMEG